jgi:hypothetical protein
MGSDLRDTFRALCVLSRASAAVASPAMSAAGSIATATIIASARDTAAQLGPAMSRSETTPRAFPTTSLPVVSDGPTDTTTCIVRLKGVPSGTRVHRVV